MRRIVLAAIDDSAAAEPELEAALGLAAAFDAEVEAVHVPEPGHRTAEDVSAARDIPVRFLVGWPPSAICLALGERTAVCAVVGARATPTGARPAGHVTLAVIGEADKPVAVVPPGAFGGDRRILKRLLVPLDGSDETADCVRPVVRRPAQATADVVVLHVFDVDTVPRFLDRGHQDLEILAQEFLARLWPEPHSRLLWGSGDPGRCILDTARAEGADLIVMSWHQQMAEGRAETLHQVLCGTEVPVLLFPLPPPARDCSGPSS